jgi:hypothetical protein
MERSSIKAMAIGGAVAAFLTWIIPKIWRQVILRPVRTFSALAVFLIIYTLMYPFINTDTNSSEINDMAAHFVDVSQKDAADGMHVVITNSSSIVAVKDVVVDCGELHGKYPALINPHSSEEIIGNDYHGHCQVTYKAILGKKNRDEFGNLTDGAVS